MQWTSIFGGHSTLRWPLYLFCLRVGSPGDSSTPSSLLREQISAGRFVGCPACRTFLKTSKNISVTTVAPGLLRTGSHKNALFKGQHRKEFAWFSLGASSPVVSMDADRAACQILDAV